MAENELQHRLLRFANFEVDLQTGELRQDGVKLRFGGQPFQVLSILLERPGEVVTRQELQKRLWPDTFVDVEHNLNTAINKIREVLRDSAETPRFVETLPRRGYRFIGELEVPPQPPAQADASPAPAATAEPDPRTYSRKIWINITASVLGISVLAFAAVSVYRSHRPETQQSSDNHATLTPVPFTALTGQATAPAFSPDGSRIAFAWNGDPVDGAKGFDLYVKALGSETQIRLTRHPSESISPTWSPDGTQIAFHRLAGADSGIYVVPALGGPERKLRSTRMPSVSLNFISRNDPSPITWSPDGKSIAFADVKSDEEQSKVYLLSMETLDVRQIPVSPICVGAGIPAFSHTGEYLAYWCFLKKNGDAILYSIPTSGGQPKAISSIQNYPIGLTWSADDKRLIYSLYTTADGNLTGELDELSVADRTTKQLAFARNGMLPAVSTKGDKLSYGSLSTSFNIWKKDLLHPEVPPVELVPSSRAQFDAKYSPDGKAIAFTSLRSGNPGVWISSEDGSDLVQISEPNYESGSPQWSPDGGKIAFDSHPQDRWEIYIADLAERKPRKLVTSVSGIIRPHWSRDGKWIYFRSEEPGTMGIYRCPAAGGDAIALSHDPDGVSPQESFDRKTVYFADRFSLSALKKVSTLSFPGKESDVEGMPRLSHAGNWALAEGGVYFVPADASKSLRYLDFATRQITPVFDLDDYFGAGLSLSPDHRWIIYSKITDLNSDIMLVDHFH